jgi:hypothetical protein
MGPFHRYLFAGIAMGILLMSLNGFSPRSAHSDGESQVIDCLDQFNGTRTSPYVADDIVSIESKQGTYDVGADYVSSQSDFHPNGFFYGLIPTNTQPASAVFEEGETISFVIRSNKDGVKAIPGLSDPGDVARLYSSDISDCDIVFDPNPNENSVPSDKKLLLDSVTVTDLGDGTYLHKVVIPSKAILGDNFTKLFIEYRDESETRVYYSLPNVEIVSGQETITDIGLLTVGGSPVCSNEDGAQCTVPIGVTVNIRGVTFAPSGLDQLFIFGPIIIDNGGRINNNQGVVFTHSGSINMTDGSSIEQGPDGSFAGSGAIFIDNTSFILNKFSMNFGGAIYNSGTITNECGAFIFGMANVVGNPVVDSCPPGTYADATNQATGQSMFAGGRVFYGEKFGPEAEVVGKVVDCVTVELRKHGSPAGLAQVGFYFISDSNPSGVGLDRSFGTIDVSTLTTGYKAYQFCEDAPYIVRSNMMVGVKYTGGDPINRIDVRRSNIGAGPDYDGDSAYHVNFDGTWHNYVCDCAGKSSRDLLFKLVKTDGSQWQ